jgi:L-alanine-DL-glutamate epimerase-like enolase superfamily enzyme
LTKNKSIRLSHKSIMGKIATIEYFRVPPRWLFVKITDADGNFGWGEASLEGHTQAVEGCLDAWAERYVGFETEYGLVIFFSIGLIRYKELANHVMQ